MDGYWKPVRSCSWRRALSRKEQLGWVGGEETRTTAEKQTALRTPATAFSGSDSFPGLRKTKKGGSVPGFSGTFPPCSHRAQSVFVQDQPVAGGPVILRIELDADSAPAESPGRHECCAASCERIEHNVARLREGLDQGQDGFERFLGGVQ